MFKYLRLVLLISALSFVMVACNNSNDNATEGTTDGSTASNSQASLQEVKFGLMPYYDYAPWALAEELGYFNEEGIKFKPTLFPVEGNVAPALANGSIDIGAFSDTPSITLAAQFEDLQMIAFHNVFKGFAIMTRPDGFKTYEQFLAELGDPKQAAIETGKQLQGKQIVTTSGATFYMVLEQALKNAGLTMDDMEVIDMEPDTGVSAFISGTGDFYLGGLPQRERLQQEGFPALISGEDIGPGAVNLAGIAAKKAFVDENPELINKIERVWFKTMEYMKSNPDEAHEAIAAWSNEQTGGSTTGEEVGTFLESYVIFPKSLEETEAIFYDPASPSNWKDRYEMLIEYHEGTGEIKAGVVDVDKLIKADEIFAGLK
ncbi:ABC transporter substrate-binding protein [Calidifontibacillus oryziterrae]|uniref:ABC transporter substrate-binding protein n=1 Tax=Calidifontibacillus oryziterrae TaxID=1191699 RepID=UPI0002F432FA|nr:ABC transporter substrate-binding protein [Calidifontibacillus oryziterrae]